MAKKKTNLLFFKILFLLLSAASLFLCFTVTDRGLIFIFSFIVVMCAFVEIWFLLWNKISRKVNRLISLSFMFTIALGSVSLGVFLLFTGTAIDYIIAIFVVAVISAAFWVKYKKKVLEEWK
jgi:hypothetical protein